MTDKDKFLAEIPRQSIIKVAANYNFLKWAEKYVKEVILAAGSVDTKKAKLNDLKKFVFFFVATFKGDIRLWRPVATEAFRDELLKQEYKPSTINRILATVKHFAGFCFCSSKLKELPSPIRGVANVKSENLRPKALDEKAVAKLRNTAVNMIFTAEGKVGQLREKQMSLTLYKAHRDYVVFEMLLCTGLRVSEVCNIKLDNIDRTRERTWWLVNLKTKAQRIRDLPIPTRFVSVLEKYLEIRQKLIDRLGVDSGYLFMNKSGNTLSRRSVEGLFKKLERLYFADYNESIRIYPHLLRHTFALNKLKSLNGDLPQLSRLLGHVGLGHVQRYTVPSDMDMENAMDG